MNDIPRPKPSCQTCRFVHASPSGARLTCHADPPKPDLNWSATWPVVGATFWCGEYQPNDEVASQFKEEAVEELAAKAKAKFAAEVRKAVEADTRAWVDRFVRDHITVKSYPSLGSSWEKIISADLIVVRTRKVNFEPMSIPIPMDVGETTARNLTNEIVDTILQYSNTPITGKVGGVGGGNP